MDLHAKQRLVGAAIWLLALIIIVPSWYSNPVHFSPDGEPKEVKSTLPVVQHAYRLPGVSSQKSQTPIANEEIAKAQQESIVSQEKTNIEQTVDKEEIELAFFDKYSDNPTYEGQWIVRLQAFNNIKQANELASKIKADYPVYIKYFEKTQVYSVRTGPYISQSKAEKAKQKLDKILRTDGIVRQLPKNS